MGRKRHGRRAGSISRNCILHLLGAVLLCAGACAPPDASYFPTAPGYEWTYEISRTAPKIQGDVIQRSIVRNLSARTVDGVRYYPKIYANGKTHYFTRSADGIRLGNPGAEEAALVIGYPLSPGKQWGAASDLFLFDPPKKPEKGWSRISRNLALDYTVASLDDRVDVPGGYFTGCLRVEAVGFLYLPRRLILGIRLVKVEQTQWYAPGVGLVKMTRREFAIPNLYPSEYTQVLTAFKRQ